MTLKVAGHLSEQELDAWFAELNASNAPLPRQNVRCALTFLHQHQRTDVQDAISWINAMDLSKPVRTVHLKPGDKLIAFRTDPHEPFGEFYTRSGASKYRTGINAQGRSVMHYEVRLLVKALEAHTTGVNDWWTPRGAHQRTSFTPRALPRRDLPEARGVLAAGGDIQLMIFDAARYLRVTNSASR